MMRPMLTRLAGFAALLAAVLGGIAPAAAQSAPAKELFGAQTLPAGLPTESFGFYAKGCLSGAVALPTDGATWQAMRLSRNRRWGHPTMIAFLEKLSEEAAAKDGWPGLLVGDISQPRGGPMKSGHASHQIGLDADIWLNPMPDWRLSAPERETIEAMSMLKDGSLYVDDRKWTPAHLRLIRRAAVDPKVQRIFVHPGIKKKICETAGADRSWLYKVRPYYNHFYHFHVRLFCPPGSPGCEPQAATSEGDGCGDLDYWFNVALKPPKPGAAPYKPKPPLTLAALPKACRVVLGAPDGGAASFAAASAAPLASVAAAASAARIPELPKISVPLPSPRPPR